MADRDVESQQTILRQPRSGVAPVIAYLLCYTPSLAPAHLRFLYRPLSLCFMDPHYDWAQILAVSRDRVEWGMQSNLTYRMRFDAKIPRKVIQIRLPCKPAVYFGGSVLLCGHFASAGRMPLTEWRRKKTVLMR